MADRSLRERVEGYGNCREMERNDISSRKEVKKPLRDPLDSVACGKWTHSSTVTPPLSARRRITQRSAWLLSENGRRCFLSA